MILTIFVLTSLLIISVMHILQLNRSKLIQSNAISDNKIFEYYFENDHHKLVLTLNELTFDKTELSKFINVLEEFK